VSRGVFTPKGSRLRVLVPRVPNFLLDAEVAGRTFALRSFSDADLRAIGRRFGEQLVERASEQNDALARLHAAPLEE